MVEKCYPLLAVTPEVKVILYLLVVVISFLRKEEILF